MNTYTHICVCVCANVLHALNVIMFFPGSKCEASARHGVILHQFGCSTLLFSEYIGQAKKSVLILYSARKGLAIIAFGNRIHYTSAHFQRKNICKCFSCTTNDSAFWTF